MAIPFSDRAYVDVFPFLEEGGHMRFLLLRRSKDELYPGIWQGVSGGVEPGETAVAAAVRELREETSQNPVDLYALDHVSTYYLHRTNTILNVPAFAARLESDIIERSEEHDEHRWLTLSAAVEMASWKPYREALMSIPDLLSREAARALARVTL